MNRDLQETSCQIENRTANRNKNIAAQPVLGSLPTCRKVPYQRHSMSRSVGEKAWTLNETSGFDYHVSGTCNSTTCENHHLNVAKHDNAQKLVRREKSIDQARKIRFVSRLEIAIC